MEFDFREEVARYNQIKERVREKIEDRVVQLKKTKPTNCSIGGVDSGFIVIQSMYGTYALLKYGGVVFHYDENRLQNVEYVESRWIKEQMIRLADQREVGALRVEKEREVALEIINTKKPLILFIDGTIWPHPHDKTKRTVELTEKLLHTAKKQGCLVCGVVKDWNGEKIEEGFSDTCLANLILNKNEALNLDGDVERWLVKLNHDFPVVLEFDGYVTERAKEIAYFLCGVVPGYAHPPPLIEADKIVKIDGGLVRHSSDFLIGQRRRRRL